MHEQGTKRGIKVLLVNPTFSAYLHSWPPLGLAYLAGALRAAGHEVRIFDPTPNRRNTQLISPDFRPDLVGISATSPFRMAAMILADRIHRDTKIPVAVGGPDVTSAPLDYMARESVAFAAFGEGEHTLTELADRLAAGAGPEDVAGLCYRDAAGEVITNPGRPLERDIDNFAMPARDLLNMTWYGSIALIRGTNLRSSTVMSARGCPFGCSFCDSRHTWTRKYRHHSPDRMVEELSYLVRDYRIMSYQFLDDTFPVNKKHTLALCEAFLKRLPGIRWSVQNRVDTMDEEVVAAMRAAGCVQMEFGVESGSQRVLDTLKKGFTLADTRRAFDMCRKYGIRTYANFIVGSPHETEEDVRATFDLCREIQPNACDLWTATPYPGTDLHAYCVEHSLLTEDYAPALLHHGPELGNQYFLKGTFTQADIDRFRGEFYESIRKDWDYQAA